MIFHAPLKMKTLVFNENINDWGDFSQAINYYERIPSPGISNVVRYNEQHNAAYVYILPNVKSSFTIESKHLIGDLCIITLIKDPKKDEWSKILLFSPQHWNISITLTMS